MQLPLTKELPDQVSHSKEKPLFSNETLKTFTSSIRELFANLIPKPVERTFGPGDLIAVVGPTGTGKSTLTKLLSDMTGGMLIDELPPAENPFFPHFYDALADKEKTHNEWALYSQLVFLAAAIEQAKEVEAHLEKGPVVWGMPILGHFMYAYLLYEQKELSEQDFEFYCEVFFREIAGLVQPTVLLVTFIEDINVLVKRIKKRAEQHPERVGETKTDSSYWLQQLNYWLMRVEERTNVPASVIEQPVPQVPMIPVDTIKTDVRKKRHGRRVLQSISNTVKVTAWW